MAKKFLTPITPPSLSSDPGTGTIGSIYYNTTTNKLRFYNGSLWSDIGADPAIVNVSTSYPNDPSNGDLVYNTNTNKMAVAYNNIWKEFAYKAETDIVDGGSSSTTDFELVLDGGGSLTETFVNNYYP